MRERTLPAPIPEREMTIGARTRGERHERCVYSERIQLEGKPGGRNTAIVTSIRTFCQVFPCRSEYLEQWLRPHLSHCKVRCFGRSDGITLRWKLRFKNWRLARLAYPVRLEKNITQRHCRGTVQVGTGTEDLLTEEVCTEMLLSLSPRNSWDELCTLGKLE